MDERVNTVVCAFCLKSPKITAYDIQKWIYTTFRIDDNDILMIQVDGIRREVHIKLTTQQKAQDIVTQAKGSLEYTHNF
jgi:hypothetical protein